MPTNNMWVKTHEALNKFFEKLTCTKCKQKLDNPQQFLNCGHFACEQCIGNETECIQCKIPGEASDILFDHTINDLLQNLKIIAETVGFSLDKTNANYNSESSSAITNSRNILKKHVKKLTVDKINKSVNISVCESTFSRSTFKSKASETIPKYINKKNKKGETALHSSCRSNNEDRVKALIEAGANPNTKDFAGWTPLQEATSYGFYNICEILLKAGALPDMCGYDNRTALHEAVRNDDHSIVSLLTSFNASRKVFDNVGKKPENYCKSKKMADLFKNSQQTKENKLHETQKTIDIDRSLSTTSSEPKVILYGSNLSQANRKLLLNLGTENQLKIANIFRPFVTHVIIDTKEMNYIKPTFDILLSMLHGKWVVSSDCLLILKESNAITANDFNLFEVNPPHLDDAPLRARENLEKQYPKLFNNCHFYFALKSYETVYYDEMKITKENLMKLVSAGDGVFLKREPRPEDIEGSLSPFHVADNPNHSLHKCTHYVIYFESNSNLNPNRVIYNMPFLKTLPFMWFVESILKFKLIDPVELGLLSQ